MAFGSGSDVDIVVKVDAQGGIAAFDKLGNEIGKVQESTKKADAALTKTQANIITASQAANLAEKGIRALSSSFKVLAGAIQQGSAIDDVAQSFKDMAKEAGTTAAVFQGQLNQATANTITNFKLQKQAIEGLRAGTRPDEFIALTKAARVLAEQGSDLSTELDQLTRAFESGRVMGLKNRLGVIDLAKAEEELKRQLGDTSTTLSDQGRILAARAALYQAALAQEEAFNNVQEDSGDAIDQLTTSLGNAADQFLATLGTNEELRLALIELRDSVEGLDFVTLANNVASFLATITSGIAHIRDFADALDDVGLSVLFPDQKIQKDALKAFEEQVNARAAHVKKLQEEKAALEEKNKPAKEELTLSQIIAQKLKEEKDARDKLTIATKKTGDESKKLAAEFKKLERELEEQLRTIKIVNSPQGIAGMRDQYIELFKLWEEGVIPSVGALTEEMYKLAQAQLKVGASAGNVEKAQELATRDIEGSKTKPSFAETLGGVFTDDKQLGNDIGNALIEGFEQGLNALRIALDGGQLSGSDIGGGVGSIVGAFFGDSQLGGQIGSIFGQAIEKFFGSEDTAGTKARKEADKFFAEMFDAQRLQVIINGQLQQLSDLTFRGDTFFGGNVDPSDPAFFQVFNDLPAIAQEAFRGVGAAFEELLGISEDAGGQLAAVFANNIGGSLENLQLLVEATGVSFEDLGTAIEQSFAKGNISALEAAQALQGLQTLAEKGIPGAFGAVDEAFKNFQIAIADGTDGGRALVDAIRDIAAEALELGITTFPDLAAYLVNTFGFAADEVQKLFEAATAAGINSVQELANATLGAGIAVAANVQAINEGRNPTFTASSLTNPSSSSGGSRSGGSGISDAERARKQLANDVQALISQSSDYKAIITSLNAELLTNSQATKLINNLLKDGKSLIQEQTRLLDIYGKRLEAGKNISADLAKKLKDVNDQIAEFGEGSDKSAIKFNSALFDFIDKFKGDIDLIRIAADAAGVSFKDLQDNAIKAFLAGKSSIVEARNAILDSRGGISGARGDVKGAFGRLSEFGTTGGRFSLDALRGIANEGIQANGKTLEDLSNIALGQGVDRGQLQSLFQTLEQFGIKTLDQLSQVSDEVGIQILGGLSDLSFPFKETNDEIKDLLDQINQIPDSKEIDLVLNFRAGDIDPATKNILKRLGIDLDSIAPGYGAGSDSPGVRKRKRKRRNKDRASA